MPPRAAFGPWRSFLPRGSRRDSAFGAALVVAASGAMLALPAIAVGNHCIGLNCGSPTSRDYVPEGQGAAPPAAGIEELKTERESGFYKVPAPVYQGEIQPRAVVYLSTPGQFGRMPASVRNLVVVRDFETTAGSEVNSSTLVVIDRGYLHVEAADGVAAVQRRRKAQSAHSGSWHGCLEQYFCVYGLEDWGGGTDKLWGPYWYGTGWHNWAGSLNNFADSMVNHRDNGDSLLADGSMGSGTRYCARQHSDDSKFSDNDIGNNQASSFALLGSDVDRC